MGTIELSPIELRAAASKSSDLSAISCYWKSYLKKRPDVVADPSSSIWAAERFF